MAKRKEKRTRRKFLIFTFILIIICVIIIGYMFLNKEAFLSKINYTISGNITYYDIYGIHMNFEGDFELDDGFSNPKLVLANASKEKVISWNLENENSKYTFKTSDYINDGINLEGLDNGTYYFLIKVNNKDGKDVYFPLINKTEYSDLTYYTLTKNDSNKVIDINWVKYLDNVVLGIHIKKT